MKERRGEERKGWLCVDRPLLFHTHSNPHPSVPTNAPSHVPLPRPHTPHTPPTPETRTPSPFAISPPPTPPLLPSHSQARSFTPPSPYTFTQSLLTDHIPGPMAIKGGGGGGRPRNMNKAARWTWWAKGPPSEPSSLDSWPMGSQHSSHPLGYTNHLGLTIHLTARRNLPTVRFAGTELCPLPSPPLRTGGGPSLVHSAAAGAHERPPARCPPTPTHRPRRRGFSKTNHSE